MPPNQKFSEELENEAGNFLDAQDKQFGKNKNKYEPINKDQSTPKPTVSSLGTASRGLAIESTISGANDSYWKKVPLENLPSKGLFYGDDAELTIRSAEVSEVRQWSTMDEGDVLDIDDTLNFILEKCCRFKLNGGTTWLSWRDILEIDRLFIIFLIHEITFPAGQNELFTKFECTGTCVDEIKFSDKLKVHSYMLQLFEMPEELMEWYSAEFKCFVVNSTKLNETFYLYMPTIGNVERLRKRIAELRKAGTKVDKPFIKMAPYLIQDWSTFDKKVYQKMQTDSFVWHVNKFTFVNKFVDLLQASRKSMVSTTCPKCGANLTAPIFSKFSFTVKDFFLISGRLNELV